MKFYKKIKNYIIILSSSIILFLYLVEGYLTYNSVNPFSKNLNYQGQIEKKWDKRKRYQVYEDLKKINDEIKLVNNPNFYFDKDYTIFPLSGYSNSETVYCNENGYYSIYLSDRFGFNNPDEEWDKEEIEFLLIGDSFTHGACVNRPNDIASILRNLSNKSVLNLGYGGNGPLIEYATLREYLDVNVKKILWIYYEGDDLNNLNDEIKNEILFKYLNKVTFVQNLKLKQNEIDDIIDKIIKSEFSISFYQKNKDKKIKNKLLKFIRLNNTKKILFLDKTIEKKYKPNKKIFTKFKKIIVLANELAIQNNSKLYFVYLPEYSRYKTKYNNSEYTFIKDTVKKLNIPFIDIHKQFFLKEENPLIFFPFKKEGHYNELGYKKVAETIYNLVNK